MGMGWTAIPQLIGQGIDDTEQTYNFFSGMYQRKWARDFAMDQYKNQVQTRVKDMKAAGLNPVLAAGAGSTAAIPSASVNTPGSADASAALVQSMRMGKDFERTDADIAVAKATKDKINMETKGALFDNQIKEHNLALSKSLNLRTNETNTWYRWA